MTTKLTKLKLKNIGGFKDFELNFHEKLTVLIGRNGTGKTTILRSIALLFDMALDTLLEFLNNPSSNKDRIFFAKSNDSHISIDLCIDGKMLSLKYDNIEPDYFESLLSQYLHNSQQHMPLFIYYPAYNAPVGNIEFSDLKLESNIFAAYISACQEGVFDFNRFFAWFKWQENIKREVGINNKL